MNIVEINHMKQAYDERQIFVDASFSMGPNERIGLVGDNGSGKTTLIKILMGEVPIQEGQVHRDEQLSVGYLRQVNEQSIEGEVSYETLSRIGFKEYKKLDDDRLDNLSGGEKTKIQLSELFEKHYDLIILDEPTNHLDYHGVQWLVSKLDGYYGASIIISHDRYFLDQVVDRVVEVTGCRLKSYNGNYTDFVDQKNHERYTQEQAYDRQEREKAQIEREIKRLKTWSDKGHRESKTKHLKKGATKFGAKEFYRAKAKKKDKQVKSKIKQLEKVDLVGVDRPEDLTEVRFRFGEGGNRNHKVLSVEHVTKAFDERVLFEDAHFYLFRGERVGLVGDNGTGKSTLINMIRDLDRDYEGTISLNPGQKLAYISQDILDLPAEKTVLETMAIDDRRQMAEARRILAQIGIGADKVDKKISQLSMGERTRIKIAKLILDEVDCLILDEPTNHLDLLTKETLEQALSQFEGTILLCSHDRYLIEKVCERLLVIEDGKVNAVDAPPEKYYNGEVTFGHRKLKQDRAALDVRKMLLENRLSAVVGELAGYAEGSAAYEAAQKTYESLLQEIKLLKE